MNTSFKTSLLYTAIILGFASSQSVAGNVIIKGNLSINGEKVTIEKAPEVSFGTTGDEVIVGKKSGDSLFVYNGKLVVGGSSITVAGAQSAVRSEKNSIVTIGSEDANTLVLMGKDYGAYSP